MVISSNLRPQYNRSPAISGPPPGPRRLLPHPAAPEARHLQGQQRGVRHRGSRLLRSPSKGGPPELLLCSPRSGPRPP